MGDVAQILGVGGGGNTKNDGILASKATAPTTWEALPPPPPPPPPPTIHAVPNRATQKLQGKSRELFNLLETGSSHSNSNTTTACAIHSIPLPPAVPAFQQPKIAASPNQPGAVKVGQKWIKIQTPARQWTWAPFSSSSRTDGALFHHWVRAGVEYPDYVFSRFDIHLDPVTYSDEEYQRYLVSQTWTKSETDKLMELARRLELRWPVIYDRWLEMYYNDEPNGPGIPDRKIQDLQFRFYQVAAILNQVHVQLESAAEAQMLAVANPDPAVAHSPAELKDATEHLLYETAAARHLASLPGAHQPLIACLGSGTSNKVFDLEYERQRRKYLEALWNRTKQEEEEERELRKELKQIEAQLRKLKKSGRHILQAATAGGFGSSPNPTRSVSPVLDAFGAAVASAEQAMLSTAPIPQPGTPYLQSARLVPPTVGGATGLNKTLLGRLEAVLAELKVPSRPLPTKRCCDLYDSVRRDALTLLLLQKNVLQKEGLLQSKRLRLEKLTGNPRALTEEAVMGLTPLSGLASAPTMASGLGAPASAARPVDKPTAKAALGTKAPPAIAALPTATTAAKPKGTKKQISLANADKVPMDPTAPGTASVTAAAAAATTTTVGKATGKQAAKVAGGKSVTGGKQPKKATTKRKRKADKSSAPASASPMSGDAATTDTVPAVGTPAAAPVPPPHADAAAAQPAVASEPPKSSGKKRQRKSVS